MEEYETFSTSKLGQEYFIYIYIYIYTLVQTTTHNEFYENYPTRWIMERRSTGGASVSILNEAS